MTTLNQRLFQTDEESRRIRQEIAYKREHEGEWEPPALMKRLAALRRRQQPLYEQFAAKLASNLAKRIMVGIVCGDHWKDVRSEATFPYAHNNTKLHYSLAMQWADLGMPHFDDYPQINVWLTYPKPHAAPHLSLLDLQTALDGGSFSINHAVQPSLFGTGKFLGKFLHLRYYFDEPEHRKAEAVEVALPPFKGHRTRKGVKKAT